MLWQAGEGIVAKQRVIAIVKIIERIALSQRKAVATFGFEEPPISTCLDALMDGWCGI